MMGLQTRLNHSLSAFLWEYLCQENRYMKEYSNSEYRWLCKTLPCYRHITVKPDICQNFMLQLVKLDICRIRNSLLSSSYMGDCYMVLDTALLLSYICGRSVTQNLTTLSYPVMILEGFGVKWDDIHTSVSTKNAVLWVVTSCSLEEVYGCFQWIHPQPCYQQFVIFRLLTHVCCPLLLPIQWLLGSLPLGVKQPVHEADHS